jgi:hypothetical protein
LNGQGQQELAADVRRFVDEMPVPRTEKEQIALALSHRVHQSRQVQLGLDQRHQDLARKQLGSCDMRKIVDSQACR